MPDTNRIQIQAFLGNSDPVFFTSRFKGTSVRHEGKKGDNRHKGMEMKNLPLSPKHFFENSYSNHSCLQTAPFLQQWKSNTSFLSFDPPKHFVISCEQAPDWALRQKFAHMPFKVHTWFRLCLLSSFCSCIATKMFLYPLSPVVSMVCSEVDSLLVFGSYISSSIDASFYLFWSFQCKTNKNTTSLKLLLSHCPPM